MVGCYHWLNRHGFGWTPGVGDGWRGWWAVVHGVTKSQTQLSNWTEVNKQQRSTSFYMFVGHLYVLFGEMFVQVFLPLFDWVFHFSGIKLYELLYILEINPLLVVSFAIIFSHSEGCLFILPIVSFAVQKLLCSIRSHLFTSGFISVSLGGWS